MIRGTRIAAGASLIALIFLCVDWELWLAPLRPGGSLLALKAAPLMFCLPGVLRGRRYTCQWACMLVLAYLAEGVVRAYSESGTHRAAAYAEIALAVAFFVAAIAYVRGSRSAAA